MRVVIFVRVLAVRMGLFWAWNRGTRILSRFRARTLTPEEQRLRIIGTVRRIDIPMDREFYDLREILRKKKEQERLEKFGAVETEAL